MHIIILMLITPFVAARGYPLPTLHCDHAMTRDTLQDLHTFLRLKARCQQLLANECNTNMSDFSLAVQCKFCYGAIESLWQSPPCHANAVQNGSALVPDAQINIVLHRFLHWRPRLTWHTEECGITAVQLLDRREGRWIRLSTGLPDNCSDGTFHPRSHGSIYATCKRCYGPKVHALVV